MRASDKKALFMKQFTTGSQGASGDCACGVSNYDIANEWDEDHEAHIKTLAENDHIHFQHNSIEFIDVDGSFFVVGCKCKTDETLFSLLNEHRDQVIRWLKATQDISAADL